MATALDINVRQQVVHSWKPPPPITIHGPIDLNELAPGSIFIRKSTPLPGEVRPRFRTHLRWRCRWGSTPSA